MKRAELKKSGYQAEQIVSEYFQNKGYELIEKNFQVRGGELDIIMKSQNSIIFFEVKLIDGMEDIMDHINTKKMSALKRTIHQYCYLRGTKDQIELRFVYVKNKSIYSYFYVE